MPDATVRGAGRMEEIMDNLNLTTLQRGQTMVNDVAIDAFAAGFRGSLLTSKDMDYNEARTIWNAMIDRLPRAYRALRRCCRCGAGGAVCTRQ